MSHHDNLELIEVGKFNKTRVRFGDPESADIKENNTVVGSYTKCTVEYKNSKGEYGPILLEAPDTTCFGVQKEYAFGKPKTPENFKGYHLCYLMETKDPAKTEAMKKFTASVVTLYDMLVEHLKNSADYLPSEKQRESAIAGRLASPIARYPKKEVPTKNPKITTKVDDKEKSLRFYARLIENKKAGKFLTQFHGPDGTNLNPAEDLIDVRGIIHPVFKVDYVYIGADSATFQVKVWEADYTVIDTGVRSVLPKREYVAPSQAAIESANSQLDEDGGDVEDEAPAPPPVKPTPVAARPAPSTSASAAVTKPAAAAKPAGTAVVTRSAVVGVAKPAAPSTSATRPAAPAKKVAVAAKPQPVAAPVAEEEGDFDL